MQREFDLKLQALSMFKLHNLPNNAFFVFHFPTMSLVSLKKPSDWFFFFYCPILIDWEKDATWSKRCAIRE